MINRRGFLQLLGALGAAAALPAEARAVLAAPEPETAPVDVTGGEGFWWTPKGGKPMRLEVYSWEAGGDQDLIFADLGGPRLEPVVTSTYHTVRVSLYPDADLLKSTDLTQEGKLSARVRGIGRFEFPDVRIQERTVHFGIHQSPTADIRFLSRGPANWHAPDSEG